jgi:hypothetical protein
MYILFYYEVPEILKAIDPNALIYVTMEYTPDVEKELSRLNGRKLGIFNTLNEASRKQCQHTLSFVATQSVN